MDVDALQKKLIAAAKATSPSDSVPYAFEKRITARLKGHTVMDEWGLWAGPLWKAAVPCVAIMLALSAWSFIPAKPTPTDFSQEIENTVLAAVEQEQGSDSIW
jgi:hypothetical protein